ncbi:MAG: DUF4377 domain-containing protein [Porphyromonadaceae bacterium]|nr:DUF4377 domain-containing protein [Porphyromonadaceae bacterium]
MYGFEYTEGYEYVLKVLVDPIENPPQDSSSARYTLLEIISKEKKDSENLPVN